MCSAPKPLVLERARNHRLTFPFSLAREPPASFSLVLAHARAIVLVQAFFPVSPPSRSHPFEFSGQAEKHARWPRDDGIPGAGSPPPPPSIQYFPHCYYSFSIRLLRNCIENNRNRNQYTRYIAIIRAIVMTVFYT